MGQKQTGQVRKEAAIHRTRFLKHYHFSALRCFGNRASLSPAAEPENLLLLSATAFV